MRSAEARKLLKQHCDHYEKWNCGRADIYFSGRNVNPRFDRRIEIYLDLKPHAVEIDKIARLLKLLDRLGKPIKLGFYHFGMDAAL